MRSFIVSITLLCWLFPGCQHPETKEILQNISFSEAFTLAKKNNKGILLISTQADCSMCGMLEGSLYRENKLSDFVFENYNVVSINRSVAGFEWLSRTLNTAGTPIISVFDNEANLQGIIKGYKPSAEYLSILKRMKEGEKVLEGYRIISNTQASDQDQFECLDYMFKSLIRWSEFSISKDTSRLGNFETSLLRSVQKMPYFYNQYLLAKYYQLLQDTTKSKAIARKIVSITTPSVVILNGALQLELKFLLDSSYNVYQEPYVLADMVEKNLGLIEPEKNADIEFEVKNAGTKDLLFTSSFTDCNCTVSDFPKHAIKPGASSKIKISYSAGESGAFSRIIRLYSNAANSPLQLSIKGIVK
ncbi:MAG: DUF1573 domain-containing protein [Chitinophagaceae bacterium]